VDIRLTMIILAGSLFGVQLGAIGTTSVKDYVIKLVMSTIMLIVAVSRGLAMPKYLTALNVLDWTDQTTGFMSKASFVLMVFALLVGSWIILQAMYKGRKAEKDEEEALATSHA